MLQVRGNGRRKDVQGKEKRLNDSKENCLTQSMWKSTMPTSMEVLQQCQHGGIVVQWFIQGGEQDEISVKRTGLSNNRRTFITETQFR